MNWSELFEYRDGALLWKSRDRSRFKTDRAQRSWNAKNAGKIAGNIFYPTNAKTRYVRVRLGQRCYAAHRIVWEMLCGPIAEGMTIDHIDGDSENNRIDNLRVVPHQENCKNRSLQTNNTSGINGVRWNSRQGKYVARIYIEGREKFLGYFEDLLSAASARKSAEVEYGYHENHGRVCIARGHKDLMTDLDDIIASAKRAKELEQ
tara:strand:- start:43 stop:657 length:615 start_codon:yes stop_codon:yes gene_type:complete